MKLFVLTPVDQMRRRISEPSYVLHLESSYPSPFDAVEGLDPISNYSCARYSFPYCLEDLQLHVFISAPLHDLSGK
jgi:hypothetical protein